MYIYTLETYEFYETPTVRMVSHDYDVVKTCFNNYQIHGGQGMCIIKYKCDKLLKYRDRKHLDWIEIDYDGGFKDLKKH